jgi:hypothetical protein
LKQATIFDYNFRLRPVHSGTVWCMVPCTWHWMISKTDGPCKHLINAAPKPKREYYCNAPDGTCYLERLAEWERFHKMLERYLKKRRTQ